MFSSIDFKEIYKGSLSKPRKSSNFIKGNIRQIELSGNPYIQIELFTSTQTFHKNYSLDIIGIELEKVLKTEFYQLTIQDKNYVYGYKLTSKEHLLTNKTKNTTKSFLSISHNKEKKYLIKEGVAVPALVDLGVMTKDGKVVKAYYDKYRQINRFLEIFDDTIKKYPKDIINIIDFGCGKSYLTFILYYYLVNIKGIKANIVGLDLKKDVILKCNEIAKRYGYESLHFEIGDISLYKPSFDVDLIITLHACDTATDAAMYHAIKLKSKYLLSVPCCQHEINKQLKLSSNGILTEYGIIKERFSALLTDSIRADLLKYFGYDVDVLEFVDFDASPKNLLIRAEYKGNRNEDALKRVQEVLKAYQLEQALYNMLFNEK